MTLATFDIVFASICVIALIGGWAWNLYVAKYMTGSLKNTFMLTAQAMEVSRKVRLTFTGLSISNIIIAALCFYFEMQYSLIAVSIIVFSDLCVNVYFVALRKDIRKGLVV